MAGGYKVWSYVKVVYMDQRPDQPPEGKLLADAAARMNLSIREAARRAGISYGRWRQITSGYQNVSPGSYAKVHAPARTLARMARAVGVTAEQMETEGQRADAAEFMLREVPPPPREIPGPLDALPEDEAAAVGPVLARYRERVQHAAELNPGRRLRGADIFPAQDDYRARLWDRMAEAGREMLPEGFTDDQLIALVVAELAVRQDGGLAAG